ncbi:unnamed protein product [Cunninghamella blakesleeana]
MDRQKKIANTLQAYFSDANLLWDKIMQQHIKKDSEGFVPFELLEKLPRLKAMKASSLEIKQAAKEYTLSHLKLSMDENSIGRIKPYIRNKTEELDDWSIYVEGFEKPYQTKETISDFFKQHIGNVSFVRIPKDSKGNERFYGYCFVEFDDKESVQKAIDTLNCFDEKTITVLPLIKDRPLSNLQLRVMSKNQWNIYKDEYVLQLQKASNNIKQIWYDYNKNKDIPTSNDNNNDKINSSNNKNDNKDSYNDMNNQPVASELPIIAIEKATEKANEKPIIDYVKNVILYVDNIHPKSSKSTIKTLLEQSGGSIGFVKRKKGLHSCYVRTFSSDDTNKIADYFKSHALIQTTYDDTKGTNINDMQISMDVDTNNEDKNNENKVENNEDEIDEDESSEDENMALKSPILIRPISGQEEEIYWKNDQMRETIWLRYKNAK